MEESETIFAVVRLPDGTLMVDWHPSLYPVIDEDGKDTDKLIDMAEGLLEQTYGK